MKQAILITAYKNFKHLEEIINFFGENFDHYIHIDKRSEIHPPTLERIKNRKTVKFVSRKYTVHWGGINHLKAILLLAEKALKDPQNEYFHLISGHDFPIKNKQYFEGFFNKNRNKNFLDYFDVPKPGWADNGGMNRLVYYNFFDFFDYKIPRHRVYIAKLFKFQKKIGVRRSVSNMPQLHGGSTWWSLNKECLTYVIEFTQKNKSFLNRFKFTLCSEEFYFQTIILNSNFSSTLVNNNLRFIDWNFRNGNNPAVLDDSDFNRIMASEAFFARKLDFPTSTGLLEKIKKELND